MKEDTINFEIHSVNGEYGRTGTPEMHMREDLYKLERRVQDLEERLNNIAITRKDTD